MQIPQSFINKRAFWDDQGASFITKELIKQANFLHSKYNEATMAYFSTIFWRRGIHDAARWQFWRKTQRPLSTWALLISSSARGPWPRPSEIMSRWSELPRSSLANLNNCDAGSHPESDEKQNFKMIWHPWYTAPFLQKL